MIALAQRYDPLYIDVVEDEWTHDHCIICFVNISEFENENTATSGYFDGYDWICKSCYETIINVDDLEKAMAKFPKYEKVRGG